MLGSGLNEATFTWNTVVDGGSELQIHGDIYPPNASNRNITWEVIPGTGDAVINENGLLTAIDNGSVTVRATSDYDPEIYGEVELNIIGHIEPVQAVNLTSPATAITSVGGTLRLTAEFSPADATTQKVIWEVLPDTGNAFVNATGLVTAIEDGTVTIRATAIDGTESYAEMEITISGQTTADGILPFVPVTGITLYGDADEITANGGTLQMYMEVYPTNAGRFSGTGEDIRHTPPAVRWEVIKGTGDARIGAHGYLTAITDGTITVRATATDGSNVFGEKEITISGQETQSVPVTALNVFGANDTTVISIEGRTLSPFHHFQDILSSPLFRTALQNTIFIWLLNFIPQMVLALALAAWFTNTMMKLKGVGFFKIMFYMPNIITAASIALLFSTLFGHPIGPVNDFLVRFGFTEGSVNILNNMFAEPFGFRIFYAQLIVAFIQFWMWYGVTMIILVAGIMGISPTLFEAAAIDGATHTKAFFHVTLPALRTIVLYVLVTSFVGGMQMFDIPRLFNNGLPQNSTLTTSLFIFQQAFEGAQRFNRAAAASMIMFVIICVFSSVLFYIMRDKDAGKQRRELKAREKARRAG
ncbi:MAG: Ig-like domain-containing protein [Defluviitaleaceae bacterium]|nr:Ig-like domain-containing protein [Defluviitaleaceae bacterium]MCL2262925.1 Ig-like domain-containing protein [Defluviitaleaceae bacterium]